MRVLVTCIGSTNAVSIVKALREQAEYDVEVLGVDCEEEQWTAGAAFCDAFLRLPPVCTSVQPSDAYVAALRRAVGERRVDLVFPILDLEVVVLGEHRSSFPQGVLQLAPQESVELGTDKLAAARFLERGDFATPTTIDPGETRDPRELVELVQRAGLAFPLIAKPRRGFSSAHVYELRGEHDLILLDRIEEPILQELLTGDELTVDLFGDGREVIAAVPRVRLATKTGQVVKARTDPDPQVISEARRLGRALRLVGPANVQGFRGTDGRIAFTDLNLRVSGGLPITTAAGVNLPLLGLRLARGEELQPIEGFARVTMCRYWQEVLREDDASS